MYAQLRKRVHDHLAEAKLPQHGGARILFKSIYILTLFAALYVALVFWAESWWTVGTLAFLCSQGVVLIGFGIMHDAGHGAFSNKKWVNQLMSRALDLVGGSIYLWNYKHGVLHHSYTNVASMDDDLETRGLLRLHPDQNWHWWHRFQVFYAFPLYSLLAINWVLSNFIDFFTGRVGRHANRDAGVAEWVAFLGFKAFYATVAFVIPMQYHAWYQVIGVWVAIMLMAGFVLALVFQLAHIVDIVELPSPSRREGDLEEFDNDWMLHQLATTADFAVNSRIADWYTGGLNKQAVHHLFPKVSHVRYSEIQPVVEAFCREHGLTYRHYPSVMSAIRGHLRRIADLARKPAADHSEVLTPPTSAGASPMVDEKMTA